VLEALKGLYPVPSDWPESIDTRLKAAFPDLQAAVAEYRPFVSRWKRRQFDQAWLQFRVDPLEQGLTDQSYWQYVPHSFDYVQNGQSMSFDNTKTYKEKFKANVDRLLTFSNGI